MLFSLTARMRRLVQTSMAVFALGALSAPALAWDTNPAGPVSQNVKIDQQGAAIGVTYSTSTGEDWAGGTITWTVINAAGANVDTAYGNPCGGGSGGTTVGPNFASSVCQFKVTTATGSFQIRGESNVPNTSPIVFDITVVPPAISINDVTANEGNSGASTPTFTASLDVPAGPGGVSFTLSSADGTATTADNDYFAITPSVRTIPAGSSTFVFNMAVVGDTKFESTETYFVNLTNVTGATVADGQGQGTIVNDDAAPTLSINDVSVAEGNSGTTAMTFTVTKTGATGLAAVVNYATADGTAATANNDYSAASGTLTFLPGETTKTISVTINGDADVESNETLFVNLSGASNATIADAQGLGTITNDDATVNLSIANVSGNEGNAGTSTLTFTVSLSAPAPAGGVTFDIATNDDTAITADGDYVARTLSSQTIPAGSSNYSFDVTVNGDTKFELSEIFEVNVTNVTGATVVDGQAFGTITNDDTQPTISINDVSQAEGNSGSTTQVFTVTLSNPSYQSVLVGYTTAPGTADSADYGSAGGTLTFAPGVTTRTVSVNIAGDTTFEADETIFVNLASPQNATIADGQGQGTITNDDAAPTISISDFIVTEGNSATVTANFTVSLSSASAVTATVNFATADGTATQPSDYSSASGTVTFTPGDISETVSVVVNGDFDFEANETYFVNLSGATNATIADGQGQGTINNDDAPVTVSPATLPNATVGAAYSQTITGSGGDGGPYNFAVTAGALPAGLSLGTASGILAGTPTAGGTFNFTVQVTDAGGRTGTQAYTLIVNAPTITLAPTTLPNGQAGVAYPSTTITPSGGTAPYNFAVTAGALPDGVVLGTASGILSGTPTVSGTFNFTVTATDSSTGTGPFTGSRAYSITLQQAAPTLTAVNPNNGTTAGGTSVTLTGTNFQNASAVTFGGTAATAFNVVNATTITATTPAGAEGPVTVAVTTPGGTASLAGGYTYVTPGQVQFVVDSGDADGSFVFTSATPGLNFTITTTGGGGTGPTVTLQPGNYSLAFTTPSGFGLASASCSPATSTVNTAAKTAALVVTSSVTTVCTINALASQREAVEAIGRALDTSARLIIANAPTLSRRLERLNGGGSAGGTASAFGKTFASGLPFSADIGADQIRFSASLSGMRRLANESHTFNAANDNAVPASLAATVTPASGLAATAAGDAAASMTDRKGPRFDVWVEGVLAEFDAAANSEGSFAILHAGADWLVTDNLLVGIGVQGDWLDMATASGNVNSSGWLAGPYATARLGEKLYLDARIAWGGANFDVSPFGTYTDKVNSDRELYSAALIGSFEAGNLTITPEARVTWYKETTDAYVDSLSVAIPSVEIKTGEVSVGPDFSWTLKQENGGVFMPRLGFDLVWTFQQDNTATQFTGAPGLDETGVRGRVEGGLAYVDPRGVEFGGALFYDGIGGGDYSAWGGTLKIRFGF